MKAWKRCIAALLALIMMVTSTNFGFAAGTIDGETGVWSATAAEVVMEHYGFASDRSLEAIFANAAVDAGFEYTAEIPYANGTEGKQDLVVVDYLNKVIYARSFESNGVRWIPTEAVLMAEGEVKETFALTESVSYYNNEEFFASEAFSYDGKSYTVEVTYDLPLHIDLEEQQRILDIPALLAQAVKNTNTTLARIRSDLDLLGREIPTLHRMLAMYLPAEEGEEAEPFFDAEKHAAEIDTIIALFAEYVKNTEDPQLDMLTISVESWYSELNGLMYAMEHGATVRDTASALQEKLLVLNESQRLQSLLSQMKKIDVGMHASLKAFYRYTNRLMSPLEELQDDESWKILDEAVQEQIFKDEYNVTDLDELSSVALSTKGYIAPAAVDENLVAAKTTVSCEIVTHDVVITVNAWVVGSGIGNSELKKLNDEYSYTVRMLDGVTQQEVDAAVRATGIEDVARQSWNETNGSYKIGEGGYRRTRSMLDDVLKSDFNYDITYEPNYYDVETNYGVEMKVPFGYLLELPVCIEEGWYDYRVIFDGGGEISYNQGSVLTVESNIEIIRTTGTAKFEYRVLDYLADDPRYGMSDLAKKILYNTALISPMVRIRIPGENISSIVDTGEGFYVKVEKLASGLGGMVWNVDSATLYDGKSKVQDVEIVDGKASWETAGFTHLMIDHSMQITRVRDGLLSRPLTEAEINEFANLPYTLSAEVGRQQRALDGNSPSAARTILEQMSDYEFVIQYLKKQDEDMLFDYTSTDAAKNAIRRLRGSESANVKGVNGEALGHGCWSDYDQSTAALYYYLRQCEDADWSVATYYEYGYYTKLAEHATLMADCLQAIVDDAALAAAMKNGGFSSQMQALKNTIPVLREMSENMGGPNKQLDVEHTRFPSLIEDLLAAEGSVAGFDNASAIYAYATVRRNGENFGSLQVTVQKDTVARTATIDYELETVNGSERYHIVTAEEAAYLREFVASAEADLNLDEVEKQYHDCSASGNIPNEGEHLKGSKEVVFLYTPKTYRVTIDGVPTSEYEATFRYGDDYVITLPARSNDPSDKRYYQYTFLDENGEVMRVVGARNGSVGHHTFEEEMLPKLFPHGTYVIYRKESVDDGVPTTTLRPKLSKEWIRGAVDDGRGILLLDALPSGLSYNKFMEQVEQVVENGRTCEFQLLDSEGEVLEREALVGTGTTIHHAMENVYGEKVEGNLNGYTIIMMGDVDGDGQCTDADTRAVVDTCFLERDKNGQYIDLPPLNFQLAANMNRNRTFDSNDAWLIRSKQLHWNGEWNRYQIIYRSVLR